MQGAYTHSHSLSQIESQQARCVFACVCSLRCRSVKLWGCESLQHGSSVQLCTHGDAGMTTVSIGNAIATTLTKRGKNRCTEFLHSRLSLSYSLSQHFLHYSCGNLHNHLETLFKRGSSLFISTWINPKNTTRNQLKHRYWLNVYLSSQKYDHSWKRINVHWKSWGNSYAQICSAVIPMLRYKEVSIYSNALLLPLYIPRQHHFPWKHVIVLF